LLDSRTSLDQLRSGTGAANIPGREACSMRADSQVLTAVAPRKNARDESNFVSRFNADSSVQSLRGIYFYSVFQKWRDFLTPSRLGAEGVVANRHRTEVGMRWTCSLARRANAARTARARGPGLPTLRPSCAGTIRAATGQESPVPPRGERAIRRKIIAQGMPDDLAEPCGDCRLLLFSIGGPRVRLHPAFPAPSFPRARN
jgi:hypothetical protein